MKRKLLLVFLTLSTSNLYATSETASISENTPLLRPTEHVGFSEIGGAFSRMHITETRWQEITRSVAVEALRHHLPSYQRTPVVVGEDRLIPLKPEHLTLRHLKGLNKTDWENWIKTYGTPTSSEYLMAIDSAAEYAEKHSVAWDKFRKEIVVDPSSTYKFFHSGTMANRRNFFHEVDSRIELRRFESLLQQYQTQISSLDTTIAQLTAQTQEQPETIESHQVDFEKLLEQRLKEQAEAMASRLESLEQRLDEETERREALEREIKELREQRTVEQAGMVEISHPVVIEAEMPDVPDELVSRIEELRTQFEELRDSITSSADEELSERLQALSDKVGEMDLDGIKADVENLKTTKVGVNFINRFSYLVQSLIIAKKRESEERRYISIEE